MTLMRSISKLTKSVDRLADATNLTKADLDAKVSAAEAEIIAAQAELLAIETARDEASAHAADAATHLATVQADVTYQGIEAVLAAKAVNAFDVFVYDTSRDSDGGAWRKRCQHTSWYNEPLNTATRGARREFPAVAVLVIDAEGLSIYDADDPALPLWMFFQASFGVVRLLARGDNGMLRAVSALNGQIVVASGGSTASVGYDGISIFDFVADTASRFSGSGSNYVNPALGLGRRNTSGYPAGTNAARVIANRDVRQVAMTVLPDAPVDPATSLPVPTIAVATAGGVSIINNDGTVADITHGGTSSVRSVAFRSLDNALCYAIDNDMRGRFRVVRYALPTTDLELGSPWTSGNSDELYPMFNSASYSGTSIALSTNGGLSSNAWDGLHDASFSQLSKIAPNAQNPAQGMLNVTTSDYNTGWMPGPIRGAFLANIDATALVAAEHLTSDAWTLPVGWSFGDGVLSYDGSGIQNSRAFAPIALPPGDLIIVKFDITSKTGTGSLGVGFGNSDAGNTLSAGPANSTTGKKTWTLSSNGSSATLYFQVVGSATQTFSIGEISVRRADADRSVNANGLIVNGTVQRQLVAEGAELVAYSGFSAANHLEQPYNSALDFSSGDFCMMGWVKGRRSPFNCFLHRNSNKANASGLRFMENGAGQLLVTGYGAGLTGGAYPYEDWFFACFVRASGIGSTYVNGRLAVSGPWAANVNDVGATVVLGGYWNNNILIAGAPPLALWRIAATAPSPQQITKIYEDEKRLFQPGAKCTLFGTSNAVTALAHDSKTNLLHVGTSHGRSVFDGLVRVDHTETPVATAISAVNGLIVER